VTIDGDLWWHIKVSPTDFTDVTRNVFVNADTSRTVEITEDEAVRSFVRGNVSVDDLEPVDGEDGDGGDGETDGDGGDRDVVYYVLVTDENGTVVDRIPVERGQETTIVGPDDDRVRGNATATATAAG
jgi:hypothetical protein